MTLATRLRATTKQGFTLSSRWSRRYSWALHDASVRAARALGAGLA